MHRNDLLLLDRGFPSFALFAELLARGLNFCTRINDRWASVQTFLRSGLPAVVQVKLPKKIADEPHARGIEPRPMMLRLVRHRLPNGAQLLLVTSVLDAHITPQESSALYQWRWRIEEGFKHLKYRTEVEQCTALVGRAPRQVGAIGAIAGTMGLLRRSQRAGP